MSEEQVHHHPDGHDDHVHDHEHDHDHALIVDRLPQGRWRVDPTSSEVLFRARALFGLLPVHGLFERFSGEMQVQESGAVSGALVIETASVDTGLARRDRDLRSPGYFDVERHPNMTFTLERVEPSGEEHLNVTGRLEVCSRQIELTFPAYAIAHGDHLHLEGRVLVDHDVAGLGWARRGFVGRTVRAEAALTLSRAD